MGLGVIRMESTKRLPDENLVAHVEGDIRPSTAHVHEHLGVGVEVLRPRGKRFKRACRIATALAKQQRGGKRPSLAVSWLAAIGGVDTIDVHADESTIPDDAPTMLAEGRPWTLADCRDFARHFDERVLSRVLLPGSYVLALHLDEKALHAQAEGPAVVSDGRGGYRVGNNAVREAVARLAPGFELANATAREKLGAREAKAAAADARVLAAGGKPDKRRRWIDQGPDHVYLTAAAQLRLVHDLYAEEFARFGVERGKGGRKRHHERVDRSKAMDAKVRAVQRERDAALERERQANERAATAEQAADAAAQFRENALGDRDIAHIAVDTALKVRDRRVGEIRDAEARLEQLTEQRIVLEGDVTALGEQRSAEEAGLRSDREARVTVIEERAAAAADRDEARTVTAAEREATAATIRERDAAREDRDRARRDAREAVEQRDAAVVDRDQANQERDEARGVFAALGRQITRAKEHVAALLRRVSELTRTAQEHEKAAAEAAEALMGERSRVALTWLQETDRGRLELSQLNTEDALARFRSQQANSQEATEAAVAADTERRLESQRATDEAIADHQQCERQAEADANEALRRLRTIEDQITGREFTLKQKIEQLDQLDQPDYLALQPLPETGTPGVALAALGQAPDPERQRPAPAVAPSGRGIG